jgi:FKBP-type peptidyl-prolyl cis-trans isomerase
MGGRLNQYSGERGVAYNHELAALYAGLAGFLAEPRNDIGARKTLGHDRQYKPYFEPRILEGVMKRFLVILLMACLAPATAVYSQNDLPQGGQPGGQGQQPQGRPGFGQQPGQGVGAPAANDPAFMQQVSYGLGRNFAMNLKDNDIQCDVQALMAGISDALRGAQPKWTEQQLETCLQTFGRQMQQQAMGKMQQQAAKNKQDEAQFLAQNGRKQGVQTTASGLQYEVLQQGKGASPTLGDKVKCNYRGTLLNGQEFDSSQRHGGKPAEFGVNQVIPGWTEALQKMHVGDKWRLYVPSKLAYDMEPPRPPIEPGSMLVFEIELLDIAKQ